MRSGKVFQSLLAMVALAFCSTLAAAHPPYTLAADAGGNVYFSDLETVWRLAPDGRLSVFRPGEEGIHVHEVAAAPDGAVEGDRNSYDPATERFYSGLWRRTPDGRERYLVPMTETPPPGWGVWQDRRGNRYTSHWPSHDDRRTMLTRRTPEGQAELVFAEGTPAREPQKSVASVGGMAFPVDGSVIFSDRNLLRLLAPDRKVTLLYRGPEGSSLRGLAVAADGRVLAADAGTKAVLAIAADGRAETLYREEGAWFPTAAAQAGGRLLVLEANADYHEYVNRVRVVEVSQGKARVVAQPGAPKASTPPPEKVRREPSTSAIAIVLAVVAAGVGVLLFSRRRRG